MRLFTAFSWDRLRQYPSTGALGWLAAVGLTALYIQWLFPTGLISGTHPYWSAQDQDITQYLAGFEAYFKEPWHWPLWRIESLNWPDGTLTTFVDAIPLYAGLLKALAPQSWSHPNPFGYWLAWCLLLQATGAWWVLREAQIKHWMALITLTSVLVCFPAWLDRIGHISLMSQWLIVFAFALILRGERNQRFPAASWTTLLICALFINIYLFCMTALLCTAPALQRVFVKPRAPLMYWLGATIALTACGLWATMWPLPKSAGQIEFGFGVYSLNVLSPFIGGRYFSHIANAFSAEQHFEGFNYLGLGLLLLIALATTLALRSMTTQDMRHRLARPSTNTGLMVMLLLMMLYAFSNQIYWGTHLLYQWPIPDWAQPITGQLRASGRFFWPVGYALAIYSIIAIARSYSASKSSLIFTLALVIQVIDLGPYFERWHELGKKDRGQIISFEQWQALLSTQSQTLYFFPKMKCAQHSLAINTLLPIMRFASEHNRQLNTGYLARYNPTCQQEHAEIGQSTPSRSAYIFVNAEYSAQTIATFFPSTWQVHCQTQDFASVCTAVDSALSKP